MIPLQKPKLAIIGTVGLPAQYGGFESLVEQLVLHLADHYDMTIYCSGKFYPKSERLEHWNGAKLKYIPLNANGFQSIPYDMISITHAAFRSDILLILGVSGCILLPLVKFFTKKRCFVNIDGIEWKRNKWSSIIKTFLRYSEIQAVEVAETVITDNEVIKKYLKATYNYDSYLIEYGGDQAFPVAIDAADTGHYPFLAGRYTFMVCRIEPENHIHILTEAMSQQGELPLVIVGNWNNSEYGRNLREKYGHFPHFYLLDPIYEKQALNLLRSNCYLYLHGHSAGGTNPSLVEAMNLALPILAYDVGYNRETTEDEAFYFSSASSLLGIIQEMTPEKAKNAADRMKAIAARRYTWEVIARKYDNMMR